MRGLNHPGIVRLLNFTESREHYYLTLECVPSRCLADDVVVVPPELTLARSLSQAHARRRALPPDRQAYLLLRGALSARHPPGGAGHPVPARGEGRRPSVRPPPSLAFSELSSLLELTLLLSLLSLAATSSPRTSCSRASRSSRPRSPSTARTTRTRRTRASSSRASAAGASGASRSPTSA